MKGSEFGLLPPGSNLDDISPEVFRKSVDFVTGGGSDSNVKPVMVPNVQGASVLGSKDVLRITGKIDADGNPVEREYLWLPSMKEKGPIHHNRIDRFIRMDFQGSDKIFLLYTPRIACIVFLLCGLLLLCAGILFVYLTTVVPPIEIPYTEDSNDPIEFVLEHDLEAPVYFFYRIENFYINHKLVSYEASPNTIVKSKCKTFSTFAEILDLRCINGKNTLNGIDSWCIDYKNVPEFRLPAYPCGPISATLMTDNFEICPVDDDEVGQLTLEDFTTQRSLIDRKCIPLSMRLDLNHWGFFRYNNKRTVVQEGFLWMDMSNTIFRSWVDLAFDSKFLKPYAVSYSDVKAGKYKVYMTNNLWPAKAWQAKKSIYITCTGKMGTKAVVFEIIMFVVAAIYIITGVGIMLCQFYGIKFNFDPWKNIKMLEISYGQSSYESPTKQETQASFDPSQVPRIDIPCLCPCH